MNDRDFERKILDMENEVRALKTAHERGLGVFEFYSVQATYNKPATPFGQNLTVKVKVAEGEETPPFVQMDTIPLLQTARGSSVSGDTATFTFFAYMTDATTITFRALSPSRLESITVTEGYD